MSVIVRAWTKGAIIFLIISSIACVNDSGTTETIPTTTTTLICRDGETKKATCSDGITTYLDENCVGGEWHQVMYIRNPCESLPSEPEHGEIKAEWIKTDRTFIRDSEASLSPDNWCVAKGTFRIYYEDGINASNRTILGIREGYGSIWYNITTDENGIGTFNISTAYGGFHFEFVDKTTNKGLLKTYAEECPTGEA
jgi:hypothetical protein